VALQTLTITNGSVAFSDPAWTNYPTRFYRVRSPLKSSRTPGGFARDC